MGREIKFRGLDSMTGTWVRGNLVILGTGSKYIIPQNFIGNEIPQWLVDRDTTGQFIGLKDKNGTEIYEGDILTDYGEEPPLYVEYSIKHGAFCFVDKFDRNGTYYYTAETISYEQFEIIGNIYENPELLVGE